MNSIIKMLTRAYQVNGKWLNCNLISVNRVVIFQALESQHQLLNSDYQNLKIDHQRLKIDMEIVSKTHAHDLQSTNTKFSGNKINIVDDLLIFKIKSSHRFSSNLIN